MFNWFKKKEKSKCKHYKIFGEQGLKNMVSLVKFSPLKDDVLPYGVSECVECGKRAFSCTGLHLMGEQTTSKIDAFITYDIPLGELTEYFDEIGYWYRIEKLRESV